MISFITPPVALAAFAAAPIAKTGYFRIGLQSMRLGTVIYIVPFVFALNPALVLRGTWDEILTVTASAFLGVFCIGSAMQGYMIGAGAMPPTARGQLARALVLAGGLALIAPGNDTLGLGLGRVGLDAIGIALAGAGLALLRLGRGARAVL